MMHNEIECPVCGNTIIAKSTDEPQKCRWCRRMFKVTVTRRNKESKKAKFNWEAEPVDFVDEVKPKVEKKKKAYKKPRVRSLNAYSDKDIYG